MDLKLSEYLSGKVGNHLLPFFWQHGDHHDRLVEQVARIAASGCRALCVESRPHKDFCGETWWRDMDVILAECEKRNMKVWILDDNHFPTGNANGLLKAKYPELRKWHLVEHHVDMIGPMKDAGLLVNDPTDEHQPLGAFAYARNELDETLAEPIIDVTDKVHDGQLIWDVPRGCWRVFFLYKSRQGALGHQKDFIDMMRKESVEVLIEAVYQPHWEHYSKYFGKTLAGFFSDEPGLGNAWFRNTSMDLGMYNRRVGMPALAMPWHDDIQAAMTAELGENALPLLPALWYDLGEKTGLVRLAFMDQVTRRYRDCFVKTLGNWCREHGVEYIGHIIEDMNAHGRMGCSGGHYFRSQEGQDMSGMDVVLHQVMPGMSHIKHTSTTFGGFADPEFFQYTLPKLCSSAAQIEPSFRGRAMCEVFGAFGWAEGTPFMKWLMDFLLVRGINQFVPHAFSPTFPDPDCPPHFGAEGHDPQFPGFTKLMGYTNRVCHLLDGGKPVVDVALLYHAEAEWMSRDLNGAMLNQKPARVLMDNHVDFHIMPGDVLAKLPKVEDGKFIVNGNRYGYLIVPESPMLPPAVISGIACLADKGVKVWFLDQAPEKCDVLATIVPFDELSALLQREKLQGIGLQQPLRELRFTHLKRKGTDIFFFVNENLYDAVDAKVTLPVAGQYLQIDPLEEKVVRGKTNAKGTMTLKLAPYESAVVVLGNLTDQEWKSFPMPKRCGTNVLELKPEYKVELASWENLEAFEPYCKTTELFNVTGHGKNPAFSGNIRYKATIQLTAEQAKGILDLGVVGQTAQVWLNGKDLGLRICPPYQFNLAGAAKSGENKLEILVANTLANKVRDRFSFFVQLTPSGLMGPVEVRSR